MSKMQRVTSQLGDYCRGFSSEDNKHYRVERQNLAPVVDHVKHLDEKVNTAPKAGNTNDMRYLGSIPMVVLTDWIKTHGYAMDQWARDEDNCKARFMAYLKAEMPAFLATKRKSSQILMG